jgi:DNA-binding MarR family transcriptional regulator
MASARHETTERLLLELTAFGQAASEAMAGASQSPDLVANGPLAVLAVLDLEGPKRPTTLQDLVGLTSGGTTKLIDRLEAVGFVKRTYGAIEHDHRGVEVAITPKGRRHIRAATTALTDYLPEARAVLKGIVDLIDDLERDAR